MGLETVWVRSIFMTADELKSFILENKANPDIKAVLRGSLTWDDIKEDENLAKQLSSFKDSEISKAIEAYKEKGFAKAVEEEVKKRSTQTKPEWQIEIENLKAELTKKEKESLLAAQKARATKVASEKGLPLDILDKFIGETDEATDQELERLSKVFEDYQTKIKQDVIKNHNITVPNNGNKFATDKLKEIKLPEGASKEEYKKLMMQQRELEKGS